MTEFMQKYLEGLNCYGYFKNVVGPIPVKASSKIMFTNEFSEFRNFEFDLKVTECTVNGEFTDTIYKSVNGRVIFGFAPTSKLLIRVFAQINGFNKASIYFNPLYTSMRTHAYIVENNM